MATLSGLQLSHVPFTVEKMEKNSHDWEYIIRFGDYKSIAYFTRSEALSLIAQLIAVTKVDFIVDTGEKS